MPTSSRSASGSSNPPSAPVTLTATPGDQKVTLTWTASANASSYNVKQGTASGGPYTLVGSVDSMTYTATGLTNGTPYYYVVTAVNSAGESGNSNEASATPTPTPTPALVSQDSQGWTVVKPSPDTKIVYVSSTSGDDKNDGLSEAHPVKTLGKGSSLVRPGHPDWLLLKSGDVWNDQFGSFNDIGGSSADAPMLFSSYGTGARPQIRPTDGTDVIFGHVNNAISPHFYMIGLDFYDALNDPDSPNYQAGHTSPAGIQWLDGGDDILIEDCSFRFLGMGVAFQYNSGTIGYPNNIRIRRNQFFNLFNQSGGSLGGFYYRVNNLLVEENIYDHVGWNDKAGVAATVFNHNIYLNEATNSVLRGNLFGRASSLSVKLRSDHLNASSGILMENNFLFESELGVSVACGAAPATQPCLTDYTIRNNVFLQINRDNPTGRGLGWGMEAGGVKGAVFSGNIFSDFSYTANSFAIHLFSDDNNTLVSDITIQDNLVYRVAYYGLFLESNPQFSNIMVKDNTIQDPDLGSALMAQFGPFTPYHFSGNTYSGTPGHDFAYVEDANGTGSGLTYSQWVNQSGETGSRNQAVTYPNPNRALETYQVSLGDTASGNQALLEDFYAAIRKQSKTNWDPRYTAAAVNNYVRAGFGRPAL